MFLRHRRNEGELDILPKHSYRVCCRRRNLKTSLILLCISPPMKAVVSGVQAEAYCPLYMAVSSAWRYHGNPVCAGMTSSTKYRSRSTAVFVAP